MERPKSKRVWGAEVFQQSLTWMKAQQNPRKTKVLFFFCINYATALTLCFKKITSWQLKYLWCRTSGLPRTSFLLCDFMLLSINYQVEAFPNITCSCLDFTGSQTEKPKWPGHLESHCFGPEDSKTFQLWGVTNKGCGNLCLVIFFFRASLWSKRRSLRASEAC